MKSFIVVVAMVFSSLVFADSHTDNEKVQCDALGCWRLIESQQEMEKYCELGVTKIHGSSFYCLVSMPEETTE